MPGSGGGDAGTGFQPLPGDGGDAGTGFPPLPDIDDKAADVWKNMGDKTGVDFTADMEKNGFDPSTMGTDDFGKVRLLWRVGGVCVGWEGGVLVCAGRVELSIARTSFRRARQSD